MNHPSRTCRRSLLPLAAVLFFGTSTEAQKGIRDASAPGGPGSETGFNGSAFYKYKGEGADFLVAGVTTRVAAFNAPQAEPFLLDVPELPADCVEVAVIASWNFLHDSAPQATHTIFINGVPVTGTFAGSGTPDLCWGLANATSYSTVVPPGVVSVGGSNEIAGATDGFHGPMSAGEGIHLLAVYECPGGIVRTVDVFTGYTSTETNAASTASVGLSLSFPYADTSLPMHFFLNALDGQVTGAAGDNFFLNGLPASGLVAGTIAPGDAWVGLLGHAAVPAVDWLYDAAEDDISAFMTSGATTVLAQSSPTGGADCIGHSFAAVSYALSNVVASTTNIECGTNPSIYTVNALPKLGQTFEAEIGASPNGHLLGALVGHTSPLSFTLGGGQCLLVDIFSPQIFSKSAALLPASYSCPVPCDPAVAGTFIASQGILVGGGVTFELTNAHYMTAGV